MSERWDETSSLSGLKNLWRYEIWTNWLAWIQGVIILPPPPTTRDSCIKDVRTNLVIFGTLHPPVQACPHLADHPLADHPPLSPCPCGHKVGIIWDIATCEQFTLKGKKTDHSVWKERKKHSNEDNIRNDVITLRSIHFLLNTSRMKILYTDILPNDLSKFHKYGSYNFFSKQTSTFGLPPPPPVRICPLLPDPFPP